jgi:large subunit ribosomal protein L13
MKTFSAKPNEIERKWYVIDAKGKVLGQVAVEAARLLRGKQKPTDHKTESTISMIPNPFDIPQTTGHESTIKDC